MKFNLQITRYEKKMGGASDRLKGLVFEAPSIQAAKARATREANETVLVADKLRYDDTVSDLLGQELRFTNWGQPTTYEDKKKRTIAWVRKTSEPFNGNYETGGSIRYGCWVSLYWEANTETGGTDA